jgi:hypothetical protein
MINPNTEALAILLAFRHGHHTNVAKRTMNNRDACAFLLWRLGPMKVGDIRKVLNAWRGPSTNRWVKPGRPLAQTYLFNSSASGGYGCVADDPMQRGWTMSNDGWSGIVKHGWNPTDARKTFFRRTYWYRPAKGTYAPTLECAKRIVELGLERA